MFDGVFDFLGQTASDLGTLVRDVIVAREGTRQAAIQADTSIRAAQGLADSDRAQLDGFLKLAGIALFGVGIIVLIARAQE